MKTFPFLHWTILFICNHLSQDPWPFWEKEGSKSLQVETTNSPFLYEQTINAQMKWDGGVYEAKKKKKELVTKGDSKWPLHSAVPELFFV